jgi:hypothetical protein
MHCAPYIEKRMRHTVETKREQKFPNNGYTYMEKHKLYPHHSTAKFRQTFLKRKRNANAKTNLKETGKSTEGGGGWGRKDGK